MRFREEEHNGIITKQVQDYIAKLEPEMRKKYPDFKVKNYNILYTLDGEDDDNVSVILNTTLIDGMSPDEIGRINDLGFELLYDKVAKKNYPEFSLINIMIL